MGVLTPRLVSSAPGVPLITSPHKVYGLQTSRSDKQIFCVKVLLKVEGPAVRGYMDWGCSGKRLLTSSHAAAPSIQPWSFHHLRHRNTHTHTQTGISPVPNIYSTIPHTHRHAHTQATHTEFISVQECKHQTRSSINSVRNWGKPVVVIMTLTF